MMTELDNIGRHAQRSGTSLRWELPTDRPDPLDGRLIRVERSSLYTSAEANYVRSW